jgi:adenosylhomocysteine nucleosidase
MAPAPPHERFVGIVAALPAEARCLVPSDASVGTTCVVNRRVRVHVGGIGAAAAERAATSLIADGAAALVSWGFAAGLGATLAAGTLVIGTQVVDRQTSGHEGDGAAIGVSHRWAERLATRLAAAASIVRGTIACPDHVVGTTREKRALGASGAVAADMETAAIANAATGAGVPWLALRVVVDAVDVVVPPTVAAAVDATGHLQMARLIRGLILHPSELVSLPTLARAYRRAMRTLGIVGRLADEGFLIPDGIADRDAAAPHRR